MLGDKVFRIALLISLCTHSTLLMPWSDLNSLFRNVKSYPEKPIEINYVEIKIERKAMAEEKLTQKASGKSEISPNKEKPEVKIPPPPQQEEISLPAEAKLIKLESPKPNIEISSQKANEAYADYYNLIREKIRATLLKMYEPRFNKGDVYLEFALRSDGNVEKAKILDEKSIPSQELKAITLKALKKSSPFPAFPNELRESKISFSVIISFRK